VASAVNGDRTSTIAQVPDSSGAQAVSTPAGRAERTVEAVAESVDAAEHRFTIDARLAEGSAGNQEERCQIRSDDITASFAAEICR
jgi:predicted hotdog family 3-hydroxylacyl-ACP dehydratase